MRGAEKLTFVVGFASTVKSLTLKMSWSLDFNHGKIYPSAKFVENNLRAIGYVRLIVRSVYLTQVVWIEADYWFPLPAQDDKMLKGIQW
jgi:hypothetical protein